MNQLKRLALPCIKRRAALARALRAAGGGVALLPTAPLHTRNADSEYSYRFDSDFHHLTGFGEPGCWLVLDSEGHSTLLLRDKDPEREVWDGLRLGVEAAAAALGVDRAVPVGQLDELMPGLLANQPAVWWPFGTHPGLETRVAHWLAAVRAQARQGIEAPAALCDLGPLLADMRLFKDEHELGLMREAGRISADAHRRAMAFCAGRFKGGASALHEYEIEAELLHEFRRRGASVVLRSVWNLSANSLE